MVPHMFNSYVPVVGDEVIANGGCEMEHLGQRAKVVSSEKNVLVCEYYIEEQKAVLVRKQFSCCVGDVHPAHSDTAYVRCDIVSDIGTDASPYYKLWVPDILVSKKKMKEMIREHCESVGLMFTKWKRDSANLPYVEARVCKPGQVPGDYCEHMKALKLVPVSTL
jgi:hypothetical protein